MADNGLPSTSKMQQMGLYGTTVVSDSVAMDVRGFGYQGGHHSKSSAVAWGHSSAGVGIGPIAGADTENGYFAKGEHVAGGANLSFAGVVLGGGSDHGFLVVGGAVFAGGGSVAFAH
jgi:hypothetical protein